LATLMLGACGGRGGGVSNNNNNGGGECGNGVIEGGESCDGSDLGDEDCSTQGFLEGTLACTSACQFDVTECSGVNPCGDGTKDATEACDGQDFGVQTCATFGFEEGSLVCTNRCEIDTSGCSGLNPCGNGILDAGEACDGTELDGKTCVGEGFVTGELACGSDCTLDTSGCLAASGYLVINELALGNPDWLELHNPTTVSVNLGTYQIHWWGLDGGGNPVDATRLLPDYDLGPGEFVQVQDSNTNPPQTPVVVEPGLIDLRANVSWDYGDAGALLLEDSGGPVDYLRWGDDTFDPGAASWSDQAGFVPSDFPGGRTLGRAFDGVDSDMAADFCVQEDTRGAANSGCLVPGVLPGELLINEIDVGGGIPNRPDSLELLNAGSSSLELGGLLLLWYSSNAGNGQGALPDYTLGPGELVVIVDDAAWNEDPWAEAGLIHVRNINWNDTMSGACALLDPALGTGIDFVRWGENIQTSPLPPDTWDDQGGRLPLIPGPDGTTLGRQGATDTNTAADFCLMTQSLGAANGVCL
jgi:hypothetical protein